MIRFFKCKIGVLLVALAAFMFSCTAEQDVAPVDSPEDNPVATIEPVGDYSTITEGDTLVYTITMSAMVSQAIDWSVALQEGSTASAADYVVEGGTIQPYSMSTQISIIVLADEFPEQDETFNFEISAEGDPSYNFQLGPNTDVEVVNNTIVNVNDPTLLTVAFIWEDPAHASDFDLLIEGETLGSWGAAASADNPEISTAIWNADDDDTFFIGVDPYDVVSGDINFSLHIGYPDGSVEIFDGVFNVANLDSYATNEFTAWGIPLYRVATVVKSGDSYDVTFEF